MNDKPDQVQGLEVSNLTSTPASSLERLRQPFDPDAWSRFVSLYAPMIYFSEGRAGQGCRNRMLRTSCRRCVILLRVLPTFSYDRDQSFRRWLRTVTLNTRRNLRKRAENRLVTGAALADDLPSPEGPALKRLGRRIIGNTASAGPSASCRPCGHSSWRAT